MKTVGLIVEYNPLHNGHAYHFQAAREQTGAAAAIAVMSGHFLQRGEPAITNKWARAEMALHLGIDLVLELPFVYAARNAEQFAYGAVSILHATGVVDTLCFGSESGDISWMMPLAKHLAEEPALFQQALRLALSSGTSYPAAYAHAVNVLLAGLPDLRSKVNVSEPNNILGLNYCMALARLQSPIVPVTVQRSKAGYHQPVITDHAIASATAIRRIIRESGDLSDIRPYVPGTTYGILQREKLAGRFPVTWDQFYPYLLAQIITRGPDELAAIFEMGEGLENRVYKQTMQTSAFEQLLHALKTKRYTWNRLQRTLLYILLNLTEDKMKHAGTAPAYIRVLGFTEQGRMLLKQMKETCSLPIITRIGQNRHPMLTLDIRAGEMYAIGLPAAVRDKEKQREFWQSPLQV
ncbi:nucleotidyltransferase [Aneurinibacillus terranovensis]|uniref:nucleotidyltransferase n=1 Tax=Aneurinibacillus terranovensis TaxID=278991 RepID=UPI0003F9ECFC|nr:nucleotidyltransferase [Aneurinibacillus terranovensis]